MRRNLEREHSPPRRGGVAATPIRFREATLIGADGWSVRRKRGRAGLLLMLRHRARASRHPVCAASVAPRHLLMAQPPLLCEEGNVAPIWSHPECPTKEAIRGRAQDLKVILRCKCGPKLQRLRATKLRTRSGPSFAVRSRITPRRSCSSAPNSRRCLRFGTDAFARGAARVF